VYGYLIQCSIVLIALRVLPFLYRKYSCLSENLMSQFPFDRNSPTLIREAANTAE
jgi:hypothetical protein